MLVPTSFCNISNVELSTSFSNISNLELSAYPWNPQYNRAAGPSQQEACTAYCPHPSEGRQNETHNHRKLTKMIPFITTLHNLMKLWAILCRATQDDGSWWRVLTKCGPLEKGMATLQQSCLENPVNSMKRQKDNTERWTPQVSRYPICYWRRVENSSRRNEETEPKRKVLPVVDVSWGEGKLWCCKE